ncbi:TNT domain-containing protein [Catellatospora paridis]|uniref:TNT domain-containing protein n=1 Tax=Catellatospora paridis TaxID=1617086 RepID=UPI001E2C01E1|nr:TNT domain-containing protein [Catellatospora paridis]
MKIRLLVATLAAALLVPLAPAADASAALGYGRGECRPGTPALAPATQKFYDPAQPELGPKPLPRSGAVGPLLHGYQRFGTLAEADFVAQFRDGANWVYPPNDGFMTHGDLVDRNPLELTVGARLDRFGFAGGSFLAPVRTPYADRALPPQNLNTPEGAPHANYHVYCVAKSFTVDAGMTAPWFGQPGLGMQYKLMPSYLPEAATQLSVTWLLANGYLVEEMPAVRG